MSSVVQKKIDGRITKGSSELTKEHWIFLREWLERFMP